MWLRNTLDLALVTGQRREDVSEFRFSDIRDDCLFVTQEKTGHKLAIPLVLKLEAVALLLGEVIERCRTDNPSDYLIFSAVRCGGGKPGPLTSDALTQAFSDTRDQTHLKFCPNPPSFHESRILASRLYKKEKEEEFTQWRPGHKNIAMTKKYMDARGAEFDMI